MKKKERVRTGISTLKVDYNSVFGFYIEISKAHAAVITDQLGYVRKQTLVNAERFITSELKRHEEVVLSAQERVVELEYELFEQVTQVILQKISPLQSLAKLLAYLDCLSTFAALSLEHEYVRPKVVNDKKLTIINGRHPVVERFLQTSFVPNSTTLTQQERMMLITGPNMAGKSTYIRQVALIVLMAHIGCYVPADQATIGITDRIFSRIGASDALHKGLSTFMVEMTETAKILHHLTDRSLVIVDEIGRGTGTSDGMSIAQAIAEYLVTHPAQPFVFFATHFHELAELATDFPGIANYAMAVQFQAGKLHFLRTIQRGATQESFGVEVAQQAGLPSSVVKRAELLRRHFQYHLQHLDTEQKDDQATSLQEVFSLVNLETISPKEALDLLYRWQKQLTKE